MSLSVALCTHNGAAYIEEQLQSILDQSLRPDEIVVSDDASADATLKIVETVVASWRGPTRRQMSNCTLSETPVRSA